MRHQERPDRRDPAPTLNEVLAELGLSKRRAAFEGCYVHFVVASGEVVHEGRADSMWTWLYELAGLPRP